MGAAFGGWRVRWLGLRLRLATLEVGLCFAAMFCACGCAGELGASGCVAGASSGRPGGVRCALHWAGSLCLARGGGAASGRIIYKDISYYKAALGRILMRAGFARVRGEPRNGAGLFRLGWLGACRRLPVIRRGSGAGGARRGGLGAGGCFGLDGWGLAADCLSFVGKAGASAQGAGGRGAGGCFGLDGWGLAGACLSFVGEAGLSAQGGGGRLAWGNARLMGVALRRGQRLCGCEGRDGAGGLGAFATGWQGASQNAAAAASQAAIRAKHISLVHNPRAAGIPIMQGYRN